MKIHLLDVGSKMYGDCIVIVRGDKKILIDGSHPGDQELVLSQLQSIFGEQESYRFDLLVVTHCHIDHIGCLPALIKEGSVSADIALVAEEKLGFGNSADGSGPTDEMMGDAQKNLVLLFQEEDHSSLPDVDLLQFIEDGITLRDRYIAMLQKMEEDGCNIIRYGEHSNEDIEMIEDRFADFGLRILGPTEEHLVICAHTIAGSSDFVSPDVISFLSDADSKIDLANAYRRAMRKAAEDLTGLADANDPSAAKNDQSIVLKVDADGLKALLAGDMQFADPQVNGLDASISKLLDTIVAEGPYDFIKLTHHTALNGMNDDIWQKFSTTKNFAHTGGRNDSTHPNKIILKLLKDNGNKIKFARTDRNGHITINKGGKLTIEKGTLNNFSPNNVTDATEEEGVPEVKEKLTFPVVTNVQEETASNKNSYVEVITRIPNEATKVTVTIEIEPQKKKANDLDSPLLLAGNSAQTSVSQRLSDLLFVTSLAKLQHNIGREEAQRAIQLIKSQSRSTLLEIPDTMQSVEETVSMVRLELNKGKYKGVVIVGGYDVIPSQILSTIDGKLREKINNNPEIANKETDKFIVWSDDLYGDKDGDLMPELPVSRIPDGKNPAIILNALQASSPVLKTFFGLRNLKRPFADVVFKETLSSSAEMKISESISPKEILPGSATGAVYFMLHGSDDEGTSFWGETAAPKKMYEAISTQNVPDSTNGTVVFAGCCYAALTVYPRASRKRSNELVIPKLAEDSIALSYLKGGALAFVGCTGTHYSPGIEPYNYYSKPMHDHFWKGIMEGKSPALALFEAKKEYARKMPHGMEDDYGRAIEMKTFRQFTCLGLGW